METYSKFISPKRRMTSSPSSLIDKSGNAIFGTFAKEIEDINLLDAKKPTAFPSKLNKLKLTRWEAYEVHTKDGEIVCGVCNMGSFSTICTVLFLKETKETFYWSHNYSFKAAEIAPNLLNGTITQVKRKKDTIRFLNNYQKDEAEIEGTVINKRFGTLHFHFNLKRISLPSVVCIPFGPNRPLYTQKDLFKAEGSFNLNGKEYLSDEKTLAIIDDHKGYYPHHAHYDWITFLGQNKLGQNMGLNLTANQSIDPENYNENLLWFDKKISLLPPITCLRNMKTKKFVSEEKTKAIWEFKDEHDMVNLSCALQGAYKFIAHTGILNLDYFVVFGQMEGYVRDEDGNKYDMTGLPFIGEDKTIKF
jgi:hypothetical protein